MIDDDYFPFLDQCEMCGQHVDIMQAVWTEEGDLLCVDCYQTHLKGKV